MKGIVACLLFAAALAVLGVLCLGASRLDRQRARAQESFLTADYDAADSSLSVVERYYDYASRLPWVGDGPVSAVRARRAAVSYWQRKYSALAPADVTDPIAELAVNNLPLQVIVADSVYRSGQARAKDRAAMLQTLEGAINAYHAVLRNARRPEDASSAEEAAYNYEFVVRLRNEIVNGRRRVLPPKLDDLEFGSEGKPEDPTFENQFKQYIPLEKNERQDDNPGKVPPPVRKG